MSHRGTILRAVEATGAIIQADAQAALEKAVDAALAATRMDALEEAATRASNELHMCSGEHVATVLREMILQKAG
jgi:hypothetical protein